MKKVYSDAVGALTGLLRDGMTVMAGGYVAFRRCLSRQCDFRA